MCRVTRRDKIRTTKIRGTVKVTKNLQERRLRFGIRYVERRNDENVRKKVRKIEVV